MLLLTTLFTGVQAAQNVTLAWSPSTDPNVIGYNIYYGVGSRTYTHAIDVGGTMTTTVSNLVEGTTYYFTATAYNVLGMESDFSNEARYTVPAPPPAMVQLHVTSRQVVVTISGQAGHTYDILASQTLTNWTVISTQTLGAGGSLDFTDPNAASYSYRFYRTREKP
jgi:hypothetical protein